MAHKYQRANLTPRLELAEDRDGSRFPNSWPSFPLEAITWAASEQLDKPMTLSIGEANCCKQKIGRQGLTICA